MSQIVNQSDNNAEILLYGTITDFDNERLGYISAKGFDDKIKSFGTVDNLTLRINSNGGDVFQAIAIYNSIKVHFKNVIVRVDGLVASAASVVAMAGNKIIMPENSMMMIHNPFSFILGGDSNELRAEAEVLDKIRDNFVNIYSGKTKQPVEKLIELLDNETWMTATEAKELGFCDEVEKVVDIAATTNKNGLNFNNGFGFAHIDALLREKLPENIVKINITEKIENKIEEDKTEMEIKNIAELEQNFPDLVAEIRNTATNTERERLRTLDSLNAQGREEIIAKAKYEEPKDARDVAIDLLQADKTQAQIKNLHIDASVVDDALPPEKNASSKDIEEAAINAVVNEINRMRGFM